MSFFEPPPPSPRPPRERRRPEWLGPPDNVLGIPLLWRIVLARTDHALVLVDGATAYPNGIQLRLDVRRRPTPGDEDGEPFFPLGHPGSPHRGVKGELPPELLRLGVELADGRKATTLDPHPYTLGLDATPEGPLLTQNGGHGGGSVWRLEFWLWPQPPPGPLVFACEWPSEGVELTRIEVDAADAIEAAAGAEVLWPEEGDGPVASAGSYQVQ
jgi:hypothetical protein